jgi:hypothetical protein
LVLIGRRKLFYKIGINDDFKEYGQIEAENDFNGHFVSTFDSIFEEILNSSFRMNRSSFLITLSSIREELRSLEDTLLRSRQIENPSLQQLITEEETHFQLVELRNIFDYLKVSRIKPIREELIFFCKIAQVV